MTRRDPLLRRIETMSIEGTERHWALIPPDLAKRVKPRVVRVGDGLLTLMQRTEALRMNRVSGLGHRGEARESMIDEIVGIYRAGRVKRFGLIMAPGPQVEEIARWLRKRRFEAHGGHMLLVRDVGLPVPRAESDVKVVRAARRDAPTIVDILDRTFGIPASRRGWSLAASSAPAYEHYLAYAGASAAGVGSLRADDVLAWIGGGATLTRWRRRGVHAALIEARLRRAARLGCRWAWSETALPVKGRPQGSWRNLRRLGFEEAFTKVLYVWEAR